MGCTANLGSERRVVCTMVDEIDKAWGSDAGENISRAEIGFFEDFKGEHTTS